MRPKQTQRWAAGDFFTVKLTDGTYSIGQVIDVPFPNVASVAFFERRVDAPIPSEPLELTNEEIISAATVVAAHLDRNAWKVFSSGPILLSEEKWPNAATRGKALVGHKTYTGAILESFLNAYYALEPWDQFHDPQYLDKLLISPSKKPDQLRYK